METQICSYIKTSKGLKVVTIFGYASRGVPGIEISGCGKLSKNIKEKLIYLTRTRKLQLPTKRFVLCVDVNDLEQELSVSDLKWIEFPLLLLFWYLAGLIPIKKLDDCICAGWVNTSGEIYQGKSPRSLSDVLSVKFNPIVMKSMKLISSCPEEDQTLWQIDSAMLLEHIKDLKFKYDYMDKDSAIPLKATMA